MPNTVRARLCWTIAVALIGTLAPASWVSAQTTAADPLPLLTTIQAIRSLTQDEGAKGYPVRVRGIVTHVDENADVTLIIHDGALGQFVAQPKDPAVRGTVARTAGAATRSKSKADRARRLCAEPAAGDRPAIGPQRAALAEADRALRRC